MEKDATIYEFDGKEVPEDERDRVYAENPGCEMAVVYTELRHERVNVGGRMQWVDRYTTKMIPFRTFRAAKQHYDFIVSQTHRMITDVHLDCN